MVSSRIRQRASMEDQRQVHLLPPPPRSPRREQQPNDPQVERATAFGKEAIGITGSAIVAGVSGYKDIANGVSLLFKAGGFSLLITFVSAVVLMHFQMHLRPGARRNRCTDLSSSVLVSLTSVLLVATNGMFVALMNRDNTVLVILVLPVVLVLGMLAGSDLPPWDAAVQGGTAAAVAQDEAYEEAMKSNAELATFGATAAFAIEGALILGYLKYPSLDGCGRSPAQVDLAVASFASMVSVLSMTATALPVSTLFPSAKARVVAVVGHLRCAMLAALVSMATILAVEFLQWWFMLSLLPEAIAVALNVAIMAWTEGGAAAIDVDGDEAAAGTRERMAKGFRAVATMSFTLMAGTYAVYLGHKKYDVYLRAAMLVMLAAVLSSLRQMLLTFELDGLPRARGWWTVAAGAVSLVFPCLALVIAIPLLVKIFVHFYFGHVN